MGRGRCRTATASRRSPPPTGRRSNAIASALRTADYLLCRRCGVYVGAVCETRSGLRAVVNVNCLDDRAAFTQAPAAPDYDGEATEARLDASRQQLDAGDGGRVIVVRYHRI